MQHGLERAGELWTGLDWQGFELAGEAEAEALEGLLETRLETSRAREKTEGRTGARDGEAGYIWEWVLVITCSTVQSLCWCWCC
jgi:hypothetical protein